jgi:hypothetical protein
LQGATQSDAPLPESFLFLLSSLFFLRPLSSFLFLLPARHGVDDGRKRNERRGKRKRKNKEERIKREKN